MINVDIAIIGGGPAGLAAAISAKQQGVKNILIIERDTYLGGILNQCIHNGFGLHTFKEELTGPEYSDRYIEKVNKLDINIKMNTMVISINKDKEIVAVNEEGVLEIKAKAIILAMGCRERPRGALNIPGSRPSGIFTAGTAQKFVNIDGYMPGKEVVILGSGDIGLIMARRMTLEGANVKAVVEIMPHSSGINRNIVQCLDDYNIPLKLSHTVVNIKGKDRVKGVLIAKVDKDKQPIHGTEEYIPCDTLLLSVGLIPENELSRQAEIEMSDITNGPIVNQSFQTNVEGIFACGNVLHVHDLVDFVSEESELAGKSAANYVSGVRFKEEGIPIKCEGGVRYTVPTQVTPEHIEDTITLRFRVEDVYKNCYICIYFNEILAFKKKARILMPAEMETVILKKELFEKYSSVNKITITTEEA